jgi:uncharacterized protein YbjT (DUF2867 family)
MILLTGATGNVGGQVLTRLAARKIPVRALVRNAAAAAALRAMPRVEVVEGDMARPESLAWPLRGITRAMLISSVDPAMVDIQSSFIAAAAKAGVRHVVKLSGLVSDLASPFRFARAHAEVERRLEASGMAFTHLRPSEFMNMYFRQVPSILGRGAVVLPMGDARISSIDIGDIGEVAAAVLTGEGHEGKAYSITGPESLSMADVAKCLSEVTGKPIRYIDVPPADANKAWLASGMPSFRVDALAELYAERRKGKEAAVTTALQTTFGVKPTHFLDFATRNATIFRGEQPPPRV